jgi:hypothetical protein
LIISITRGISGRPSYVTSRLTSTITGMGIHSTQNKVQTKDRTNSLDLEQMNPVDDSCPSGNSISYCSGYVVGYGAEWGTL